MGRALCNAKAVSNLWIDGADTDHPPRLATDVSGFRSAMKRKSSAANSPARKAAAVARQGDWKTGLPELITLSEGGDGAAAASASELLAALGRWSDFVPHAARFLANPRGVNIGNVFTELTRLVRRAARELNDESIITTIAATIPNEGNWWGMRDATLLKDMIPPSARPGPPNLELFNQGVARAQTDKRFKKLPPEQLEQHLWAAAWVHKVEDELISRYDPKWRNYDAAQSTARVLARRGEEAHAWGILEQAIPWWPALDFAQVFPVELLVDPWLQKLMTEARCEQILATPRSEFGR